MGSLTKGKTGTKGNVGGGAGEHDEDRGEEQLELLFDDLEEEVSAM